MEFNLLQYLTDSILSKDVNFVNAMFKLMLSMVLGALVGWERKQKGQVAGVRTFALISMGACLAMLLSIYVPQVYFNLKNGDPGRIAAQVVTGVGFLGGGAMIQQRGSVRGLTTAAGIWVVANIGLAVGFGMYAISVTATLFLLVILSILERWENRAHIGQQSKVISMKIHTILGDVAPYRAIFARHHVRLQNYYVQLDYNRSETTVNFIILARNNSRFLTLFDELRKVQPTETITLSSEPTI